MSHYHVAVWMDHAEARIIAVGFTGASEITVHPSEQHSHIHHKAGSIGAGKLAEDHLYFRNIAAVLKDAGEILILGPGNAKNEFVRYIHEHQPILQNRIVGTETIDHPSDGQITAYARKYFHAVDRMKH